MTTEQKLQEMLGDYYQMGSPGSPNAAILQNILGAENELRDPQSENEALLKLIYEDGQLINQEAVEACTAAKEAAEAAADAAEDSADLAQAAVNALVITDTASGAIASFSDGSDGMPVKSCVVQIEPIQDLHGYDNPWPAGGGKNLLSYPFNFASQELSGCTATVESDGTMTFSGTPSANALFNIKLRTAASGDGSLFLHEGEYIVNGAPSGGSTTTYQIAVINSSGTAIANDRGSGATFTIPSGGMNVGVQVWVFSGYDPSSLVIKPMIRLSSVSDATFAPYSNLCPISGRTGGTVYRTGVNVWDEEWEVGSISNSTGEDSVSTTTIRSKNYIPVVPGATYYYKIASTWAIIFYYDVDKNYLSNFSTNSSGSNPHTTPAGAYFIKFRCSTDYGTTYNHDISINYPSTDHDYHAYSGQSVSLSFGQTVYGGDRELVSGEQRVTADIVDLGDLNWSRSTSYAHPVFYANITGMSTGEKALVCSRYKDNGSVGITAMANGSDCRIGTTTGNIQIFVRDDQYTTVEAFTTAVTGAKVVYPLATPTETDETPITTLTTLLGDNNIWSDTGDTTVEYVADPKLYINKIAAALA